MMPRSTSADIEQIHKASLKILETVGVRLEHDEVLRRVLDAGARPGSGSNDVRIPSALVADCLAAAPREVTLGSLDGSVFALSSASEPVFWTCPVLHLWTGDERRPVRTDDLADIARLCNQLPNAQGVMGVALDDIPPDCRDFVGVRIMAENSRKHVRALCFSGRGMEALAAMNRVIPGPWLSIGFTAHGPLRWTHLALDVFLKSAGRGIPTTINGEPMAGVTAPVTVAGTLAVGNAEILAGIVVNQVLEPGRPLIYNLGLAHAFDMRHATVVTGGPENALFASASAELGRFYGLPSSSWVSTEALFEDEQAALEKMFGFQAHMSSGVGVIWGMGQLESEMTVSLAQLVIDNEMIDFARHHGRGYLVSDEMLALPVVEEVGIGGSYLETEHTFANFRKHVYDPGLLNRASRSFESKPLHQVARERARELIAREEGGCLPGDITDELRRIERQFRGVSGT